MKADEQDTKIYRMELRAIREAVKKATEQVQSDNKYGTMHAVCEVACEKTREVDMGFEDFIRCAICAWDCSLQRSRLPAQNEERCN